MRHDLTVIAYEIHIGTKYIDIYRLCRYHDLFLGAIRGRPAFAAGFGSGEGCEPDLDPAPPDARQGDLFGAEPFDRRDGRKYTFLSSYWSFRSYQASRLPSLNLSGEVLSFDRSLRLLQDYDTGEMRYLENYNLQNRCGLPHYLFRRSPHRGATSRTMVEGGRMNSAGDHSLIVNSSARSFGT